MIANVIAAASAGQRRSLRHGRVRHHVRPTSLIGKARRKAGFLFARKR
jgi:hypothetical protein